MAQCLVKHKGNFTFLDDYVNRFLCVESENGRVEVLREFIGVLPVREMQLDEAHCCHYTLC
jgi:hypothetical protein